LARGSLRFSAKYEAGIVGARVEAAIDLAYGVRYIGVIDFDKPVENSAFYAAIGLEVQIRFSIEFWLKFTIKVWRFRKTFKKSFRFTVNIGFTAGLEFALNGLTPNKAGFSPRRLNSVI
jgi:hypothetical protein